MTKKEQRQINRLLAENDRLKDMLDMYHDNMKRDMYQVVEYKEAIKEIREILDILEEAINIYSL